MMKVRILDRGEFCDGEVLMREVRRLIAIDLARCDSRQYPPYTDGGIDSI